MSDGRAESGDGLARTDGGVVLPFATPDGDHHTRAPPEAQTYDADGNPYVWIRTADGDVTRAYQRGSV